MTKQEAIIRFKEDVLPNIFCQYGSDDEPALNEAWNNYTDYLCKCRFITSSQYNSWTHPRITKDDWLEAAQKLCSAA